ncbi:unannotated protein [freshwater metagenome]|jgi:hypothetical protein|uniref:Unannotated protein n=1 Tax=freshwater metagenome TaxID=449393 RepID=A0A6J7EKT3_9ZZZZ|nr:SsgA family sporulation/cell division regulator [Actinomycetota bacterium]
MSTQASLSQDLDVLLVVDNEPALPVRTKVAYAGEDPLAVTMTFMAADHGVRWTIARDLLWDGMKTPVGDGDVHVEPHEDGVHLLLHTPGGTAHFAIDVVDLARFLDKTNTIVERGREDAVLDNDLDRTIAELFGAA